MKTEYTNTKKGRGFSLVEMLVVIAVIGIVAAVAVPTIGGITGAADEGAAKRNAQSAATVYAAAISAGANFSSTDKSGILDELAAGKAGIDVPGSDFKMAALDPTEKQQAMEYLEFDAATEVLSYVPDGAGEDDSGAPWEFYGAGTGTASDASNWESMMNGQEDGNEYKAVQVNDHGNGVYDWELFWRPLA